MLTGELDLTRKKASIFLIKKLMKKSYDEISKTFFYSLRNTKICKNYPAKFFIPSIR